FNVKLIFQSETRSLSRRHRFKRFGNIKCLYTANSAPFPRRIKDDGISYGQATAFDGSGHDTATVSTAREAVNRLHGHAKWPLLRQRRRLKSVDELLDRCSAIPGHLF